MSLLPRRPTLAIGLTVSIIALAPFASSRAETAGRCTAVPVPTDSCMLDPSLMGTPLRFGAEFGGSHDDTRLRRDSTLDGEPLACVDGSKTSLFAEDGIVHLDCRFRPVARPGSGSASVLKVALTVNHAQFISSSVAAA